MASLEKRSAGFRIKFRYGGRQFSAALHTEDLREAERALARVEENLVLLGRGRLEFPPGGNLALFLLSDGKINHKRIMGASLTLHAYFNRYQERETDAKERNTRYTEDIHIGHFLRVLGKNHHVLEITSESLQRYIDARAKEKFRGAAISHQTIHKEIGTFASIWNKWAVPEHLVVGAAPTKGLAYKKTKGKPPFQTWEQIERQIARGHEDDLWDSLFLTLPQIDELLKHMNGSRFPFVYPMFVFAARTGARRSEILRTGIDELLAANPNVRVVISNLHDLTGEPEYDALAKDQAWSKVLASADDDQHAVNTWISDTYGGKCAIVNFQRQLHDLEQAASEHGGTYTLTGSNGASAKINVTTSGPDAHDLWLNGVHIGTVEQGLWGQWIIDAINDKWNDSKIPRYTNDQILQAAGL